jgi:hypothetical protein
MYMTATAYPRLRASLAPEYIDLHDEQLDALVTEVYGEGVTAESVESFWNDVGRGFQGVAKGVGSFAKQAAPVVGHALPGIAQGALTGASVGGPFGAIAGALAGGAGGVLSQSKDPTLRGIGGAIGGATQLASRFTPGGALGGLASAGLGALSGGGGAGGALSSLANIGLGALGQRGGAAGALGNLAGSALGGLRRGGTSGALSSLAGGALGMVGRQGGALGAIGQVAGSIGPQLAGALGGAGGSGASANALLGLLSRPETVRALSSAAMGPFGRSQVLVGSQPVAVQSILSALGGLAGRAASEAESTANEALPAYFHSADGELAIDPADAEQRVDALLELFAATPSPQTFRRRPMGEAENDEGEHDESAEPEYTDEDAAYDEWLLATEAEWAEDGEHDESFA